MQVTATPKIMIQGIRTDAKCPTCDVSINMRNDPIRGEIFQCSDCGTELEVVTIQPLSVQLAPKEAEDWGE